MQKNKHRILGPAEREDSTGNPVFNLANAACDTECTGLIQVIPDTEEELEHYNTVYSYTPKRAVVHPKHQ